VKILGKLLWLTVETVVILHESMRQAGSQNTRFVDLLHRLRSGVYTRDDYELLNSRLLQNVGKEDVRWRSAPIIVTNNTTRDALNIRATEAFERRTGRDMYWYHSYLEKLCGGCHVD